MTENEAVHELEIQRSVLENMIQYNKDFEPKSDNSSLETKKKIIDVAIKALEKQIAKEPRLEGDGYADGHMVYDTWICPNCDEHYEMEFEQHMHCPVCGQKIKWDN